MPLQPHSSNEEVKILFVVRQQNLEDKAYIYQKALKTWKITYARKHSFAILYVKSILCVLEKLEKGFQNTINILK